MKQMEEVLRLHYLESAVTAYWQRNRGQHLSLIKPRSLKKFCHLWDKLIHSINNKYCKINKRTKCFRCGLWMNELSTTEFLAIFCHMLKMVLQRSSNSSWEYFALNAKHCKIRSTLNCYGWNVKRLNLKMLPVGLNMSLVVGFCVLHINTALLKFCPVKVTAAVSCLTAGYLCASQTQTTWHHTKMSMTDSRLMSTLFEEHRCEPHNPDTPAAALPASSL